MNQILCCRFPVSLFPSPALFISNFIETVFLKAVGKDKQIDELRAPNRSIAISLSWKFFFVVVGMNWHRLIWL